MVKVLALRVFKLATWSLVLYGSSRLFCQTPKVEGSSYVPHMAFDVASIREAREGDLSYIDNMPGTSLYSAERVSAGSLIRSAYDLHILQLLKNGPDWLWTTRFTLSAKSSAATDEALAKLSREDFYAEKRHMLQSLLAERFHLRIHPETKVSTTYELVNTERAAKLMTPIHGDVARTVGTCATHYSPKKGMEIDSKGCPFSILLSILQQDVGTDILDSTGMTGMYAFRLKWRPTSVMPQADEDWYPPLEDAVREQLGLDMKRTKGPVTVWVIDHIEHPTPN